MSTPGTSPSVVNSSSVFDVEFRSTVDDAWYSAEVIVDGDTLTVKFQDFPEPIHHEVFDAGTSFPTYEVVQEFRKRFRPLSVPLEDSECSKVLEGTAVCATFKGDGGVRYFDAIVEAVKYEKHPSDKCLCTFVLFWQHGPEKGNITSANIADICLVASDTRNKRVDNFVVLAKEKIKVASQQLISVSSEISLVEQSACKCTQNMGPPTKSKLSSSQHTFQEKESAVQFLNRGLITDGSTGRQRIFFQESDQDRDVGGISETANHHYVVIDNLEKNISPSSIIKFIHKETSITPQAYVYPSFSSDSCARGTIVLDCRAKLKRIYEFLNNSNHFIVSLIGRPWVVSEIGLRSGNFKVTIGSLLPTSQIHVADRWVILIYEETHQQATHAPHVKEKCSSSTPYSSKVDTIKCTRFPSVRGFDTERKKLSSYKLLLNSLVSAHHKKRAIQ